MTKIRGSVTTDIATRGKGGKVWDQLAARIIRSYSGLMSGGPLDRDNTLHTLNFRIGESDTYST